MRDVVMCFLVYLYNPPFLLIVTEDFPSRYPFDYNISKYIVLSSSHEISKILLG